MKRRLFLIAIMILALTFSLVSCGDDGEKEIKTITVIEDSISTTVDVGSTPDFSGLKVVVSYSDGSAQTVTAEDLEIGTIDTSTIGEKELTVSYEGKSVTVKITVKEASSEPTVTGITIVPGSVKSSVQLGDAYDASGIQVEAHYSDGSVKVLYAKDLEITLPDTSKGGEQTLAVKYGEFSTSLKVIVAEVSSIRIIENTLAKEVYLDGIFDTTKVQAEVTIGNAKKTVGASELKIGTIDTSVAGNKTVEIEYNGFKINYAVKVIGISSIAINTVTVADSVRVFGALDTTALTAKLTYENGHATTVDTAKLEIVGIDTSSAGVKELKIKYKGLEATKNVTVVGVSALTLASGSIKTEILIGEEFDASGISITAMYTDGTPEVLGFEDVRLSEIASDEAGTQELFVTYLDKVESIPIKVCGIEGIRVEGVSKVVVAGEELSLDEMKVYAVYSDSNKTEILVEEGITTNIDELDFDVEGEKTLVVAYGDFSAEIKISTEAPELNEIAIRTYTQYVGIGRVYDKSNVTVTAFYGNGTSEVITSGLTVGDIATSVAGDVTLTVSYTEDGITKSAEATVKVLPITDLVLSGVASTLNKGETLDVSLAKASVTYSDGEHTLSAVVTAADGLEIGSLDTTANIGDQSVKVTYLGFEASHKVFVRAALSIKILSGSVAHVIRSGYGVDSSRLELEITYNNGSETKKASDLSGVETAVSGTTYTVTYNGMSDSITLEVLTLKSVNALNGTVPTFISLNGALPTASIKLTTVYVDKNGNEYVYLVGTDDSNLTLSAFDSSTSGDKALIFSFRYGQDESGSPLTMDASIIITVNGVTSLEFVKGTMQTVIVVDQELVTSDIRIKVTYSDGTYNYIDTTAPGLSIGEIDSSTEGDKILKISYQGVEITVTVTVKAKVTVSADDLIFGVSLPDSIVARDTYKNNFKNTESMYVVGNNNPYEFYLNLLMLDENDEIVDVDGKTFPMNISVYEIVGDEATLLQGEALNAVVSIDAANNKYQFTSAAKDRVFKLVISPDGNCVDPDSSSREHTVRVVDAYNIYNAKELNIITNIDADLDEGDIEGHLSQLEAVNRFLKENGIEKPATVNGVVLHNNIDVKLSDIPSEYVYHYTKDGEQRFGLYDQLHIFNHALDNENPTFNFYGNYYSIYSYNIPCVVEAGIANNDDAFSSSDLFLFRVNEDKVFSSEFDNSKYKTVMENVAFRDNDPNSNDQAASERHMRGIICLKIRNIVADIVNVNVDAYVISMVPEHDYTTINLNQVKFYNAWQGHLFVWNNNNVQSHLGQKDSEPYAKYQPIEINITDSLLAKCGGPVILSQSDNRDRKCNMKSGANINVDDKSELYSYVTGQEAWFVAVGQTATAGQILAMNQLIQLSAGQQGKVASYTSSDKIAGVSTVNMIMVNMGIGTTFGDGSETYDGTCTINGVKALDMTNNPKVDSYIVNTDGVAPVFQSSEGGTCFTDGQTGCYGFETGAVGPATSNCFDGDYLTLYYMGMGILLEYYH